MLVSSSSWWFLTWLKTIRQLMLNGKSPQFFGWKQDIACNHHLASATFISFKCQWHYWHPKLFHGCIQSSTNGNSLPEKRSMDIFDCGKTSSCPVKWIKKWHNPPMAILSCLGERSSFEPGISGTGSDDICPENFYLNVISRPIDGLKNMVSFPNNETISSSNSGTSACFFAFTHL